MALSTLAIPRMSKTPEDSQCWKRAKYTRARLPVKLLYKESYPDKPSAMSAEALFKKKSRQAKLNYIKRTVGLHSPTVFHLQNGDTVLMTPCLLRVQLDHTFLSSKKSPSSADVEIPVQGSKAMKGPLLLVDQRTRFSKSAKSNSKPLPDFFEISFTDLEVN